MSKTSTIDPVEVAKFAQHSNQWWDLEGPLRTLHDVNPARMQFIKNFAQLKGARVLDVGCGGGILSEAMAREGAVVTGLDVEQAAISSAKEHAKASHISVDYICQPLETYEAQKFDIITCMEMLEHVTEPKLIIHHASRLLKPNGLLFLSTINRTLKAYAGAVVAAEYILNLLPRQTHDYDKFIKPSELCAMVRHEGLDSESLSGLHYDPFTRTAKLHKSVDINYLLVSRKRST